jgi:hypothetical protein
VPADAALSGRYFSQFLPCLDQPADVSLTADTFPDLKEVPMSALASALCLILSLGLPILALFALSALLPPEHRSRRLLLIGVSFTAWLLLTGLLAAQGLLSDFSSLPPRLLIILLPPLILSLSLTFHPRLRELWQQTPMLWLIAFQVFRLPVEIFLWLLAHEGIAPPQMSFEGRNWDILTGLSAPVVAWLWLKRPAWRTPLALSWNLVGLALLLNIVSLAILSMPTAFQMLQPANTFITRFPFVWLPAMLVPFAYTGHFLALRQVWLNRQEPLAKPVKLAV